MKVGMGWRGREWRGREEREGRGVEGEVLTDNTARSEGI